MKKFVAYIILLMAAIFIYGNSVLSLLIKSQIEVNSFVLLSSALLSFMTMFLPALLFMSLYYDISLSEAFKRLYFRKENISIAILYGVIALISFIMIASLLVYLLHINTTNTLAEEIGKNIDYFLLFLLPATAAITEETFFRGFIHMQIEKKHGFVIAAIISSFLFSMAHLAYGSSIELIMTFIFGIFLAASIHLSKNILSPIIAHFLYDFMAFLALMHLV